MDLWRQLLSSKESFLTPSVVGREGWCEEDRTVFSRANQNVSECVLTFGSSGGPGSVSCIRQTVTDVGSSPG